MPLTSSMVLGNSNIDKRYIFECVKKRKGNDLRSISLHFEYIDRGQNTGYSCSWQLSH